MLPQILFRGSPPSSVNDQPPVVGFLVHFPSVPSTKALTLLASSLAPFAVDFSPGASSLLPLPLEVVPPLVSPPVVAILRFFLSSISL